jgi:hypothetical protein
MRSSSSWRRRRASRIRRLLGKRGHGPRSETRVSAGPTPYRTSIGPTYGLVYHEPAFGNVTVVE